MPVLLAVILVLGAADLTPSQTDIAILEEERVMAAFAMPTKTPGRYAVEFAPRVEVRNLTCARQSQESFTCRFESRTKAFFNSSFDDWTARGETVQRPGTGNWRFRPH